ncbi:tRNA pseudouridine(13) synthase TruD [bacterium]|nr:MAG: tRNA pseudouridine(13) synthase TruD [bacterium]
MNTTTESADAFSTGADAPRYLTHDIPGIGGQLKARPEDFLVEEIPLYNPDGEGEHIFLFVEKREMTTLQLRDALSKHFKVKRKAIGHAGLKDKHAITRQVISIHTPGKTPEDFPSFQHDRASVLWVDLHSNQLKRGHLSGNRFSIKVRGVDPLQVRHAKAALDLLAKHGAPNRIGEQRFGFLMNNHLVGRAMILGDAQAAIDLILSPKPGAPKGSADARQAYVDGRFRDGFDLMPKVFKIERNLLRALSNDHPAEKALGVFDPTAAGFFISSFQSAVFNHVLNARIEAGTMDQLIAGDLAFVTKNRSSFEITAEELEKVDSTLQGRVESFELSPSGPMWGTTMARASGQVEDAETQALANVGVTLELLEACEARGGYSMIGGDRRPMRMRVIDPEVEGGTDEHGGYIRCAFELPRGSFATTVMDEVMKCVSAGV